MRHDVLRTTAADEAPSVTNLELFFDLVYVFAITQLSDFLFEHLTPRGALEALVLFGAVWWAWNYTAWATNWIDPQRAPVALLMVALMAISLVMSAAIPEAFQQRGVPFAVAYVALQVVRSSFVTFAFPRGDRMRRNVARLLAWSAISGAVWVAGAFAHGDVRLSVWLVALAFDVGAPMHGFAMPRRARIPIADWCLAGSHLAERCQLLLIIALGESVLRVGLTFSEKHGSLSVDASFIAGFLASACLWAIYFLRHAESGVRAISADAADAARQGRTAYTYAHAVMVAGVIVTAVAIRSTIDDPVAASSAASALATLGGGVLYLAGLVLFERTTGVGSVAPPLVAIVALALLGVPAAVGATRLVISLSGTLVLAALTVRVALLRPS